ncbi:hypothetical protein [uncultured Shewanella sp.]|uniref:hypothetical protein n=1 Tax=uncultured Shewanella sp. TaxID=173975 RepID=UPI00260C1A22|nr:hypothetical protein [uncultured Shewanella sp.]
MLLIGALLTLKQPLILLLVGLYLIALSLGFIIPMSTSSAMKHVHQGQGMASSLIVFCYALTSSLYSQIEANASFSHKDFMSGSIAISTALLIGIFTYLQYKHHKEHNDHH